MYPAPNELYTTFSFIGFVLSVIPLYWHLESWNTGTCLYMIWTGLGCLLQCVNSIVWNKNTINRAPVYCDISTRIQVALNVAIPACSLCLNRRLYKVATAKTGIPSGADKRRAVILDLLIGVGIPILQMITEYVVSPNRYDIFEDFGPVFSTRLSPPAFFLFYAWPVVIGIVSLYYCVRAIYAFYRRQRQFRQIMLSSQGLSSGRYLRLMALSSIEILGTIPIGTYIIVDNAKQGVGRWGSWASVHNHYSEVDQFPAIIWKNNQQMAVNLEMFRWLLVACAFNFFAFFGFAEEALQHYRRVYTLLSSRIGYPTSSPRGSSHVVPPVPYMSTRRKGGVNVSVVTTRGEKYKSSLSLTDQSSIQSTFIASDRKLDVKIEQDSPPNTVTSTFVESFDESGMQDHSTLPASIMPTAPPASVPPHFPDKIEPTIRACSGLDAV